MLRREFVRLVLQSRRSDERPMPHFDDLAVDAFAQMMREKLKKKRAEGYRGWDDDTMVSAAVLARKFMEHLPKGDMVDIANFAMMLCAREGGAEALVKMIGENVR